MPYWSTVRRYLGSSRQYVTITSVHDHHVSTWSSRHNVIITSQRDYHLPTWLSPHDVIITSRRDYPLMKNYSTRHMLHPKGDSSVYKTGVRRGAGNGRGIENTQNRWWRRIIAAKKKWGCDGYGAEHGISVDNGYGAAIERGIEK